MNLSHPAHNRFLAAWLARLLIFVALSAGITWLICLRFGWRGIRGFSDGLFLVGLLELIVSGGVLWGSPIETAGSPWQRIMAGMPSKQGSTERQQTFLQDMFQKQAVAGQALICALITILASVAISLLGG